jgi:calmodulin
VRAAVQVFDKAGSGHISTSELAHVLTSVGEKLSPEEIAELISEADPEKSGKVVYENFIKVMLAR